MREKLAIGILVGMGIMLVILGFFGWFHTNYCIEKLSYVFEYVGIDASRHYLISDLNQLMQIYVVFIVIGFMCLLAGGSLETRVKKRKKELTVKKVLAIIVLTVLASLLCYGFFFITVLIVSMMTKNLVLAFIVGLLPTLTIVVGLSISMLSKKGEEKIGKD